MSLEDNHEEFKEIRARADSIGSAIFLLAGGALSISIGLMLNKKVEGLINECIAKDIALSWYFLLAAVIAFVLMKCHLVIQSFFLHYKTDFMNKHIVKSNVIGFIIGIAGVVSFVLGLTKMVLSAVAIINA